MIGIWNVGISLFNMQTFPTPKRKARPIKERAFPVFQPSAITR